MVELPSASDHGLLSHSEPTQKLKNNINVKLMLPLQSPNVLWSSTIRERDESNGGEAWVQGYSSTPLQFQAYNYMITDTHTNNLNAVDTLFVAEPNILPYLFSLSFVQNGCS